MPSRVDCVLYRIYRIHFQTTNLLRILFETSLLHAIKQCNELFNKKGAAIDQVHIAYGATPATGIVCMTRLWLEPVPVPRLVCYPSSPLLVSTSILSPTLASIIKHRHHF